MKKLFILTLLVFTLHSNLFSQSWNLKWHNSGDDWIGGWNMNTDDQYVNYKSSPSDLGNFLFVCPSSGWSAFESYSGSPYYWYSSWSNLGNGRLNNNSGSGINLNALGTFYEIYGGSATNMFYRYNEGGTEKAAFVYFSSNWTMMFDQATLPGGWIVSGNDQYVPGNFDSSTTDGRQELFCINKVSGYATMHNVNGVTWSSLWSNGGNGWIDGWHINTTDKFLMANVDGEVGMNLFV